jgi:hypothetical protein
LAATRVALETLGLYTGKGSTTPRWASAPGSGVGQPGPCGEETA